MLAGTFVLMLRKVVSMALILSLLTSPSLGYAQNLFIATLPEPGKMVGVSPAFTPILVKGLVIHPEKPLNFDFIVDSGHGSTDQAAVKEQSEKIVKYFLAALTVPEEALWVNLSPYEKDRIMDDGLGQTLLGRDMLAQDYVLKQLTASLIYPEEGLGKDFWSHIYSEAQAKFGTTDIPVDTFNKVWIMPEKAEVFEKDNAVYVTQAKLKVMLDSDYTANMRADTRSAPTNASVGADFMSARDEVSRQLMRQIILPAIEKEVNEGKNFATLRQVYYAAILAKWYRELVQNTLMAQGYLGQNKISGVSSDDKTFKEQIYQRYIAAYKQGVFDYIKEEVDATTGTTTPKKYFSGGLSDFAMRDVTLERTKDASMLTGIGKLFKSLFVMKSEEMTNSPKDITAGFQTTSLALVVNLPDSSVLSDLTQWVNNASVGTLIVVGISLPATLYAFRKIMLEAPFKRRLVREARALTMQKYNSSDEEFQNYVDLLMATIQNFPMTSLDRKACLVAAIELAELGVINAQVKWQVEKVAKKLWVRPSVKILAKGILKKIEKERRDMLRGFDLAMSPEVYLGQSGGDLQPLQNGLLQTRDE